MKPFEKASYLSQVRRLRNLGVNALEQYRINAGEIEFINHGENTTFKVTAKNGRRYLLRIHRNDYHTRPALLEELKWLKAIHQRRQAQVPNPIPAKDGTLLVEATAPGIPDSRAVSVLQWIDGKFVSRSLPLNDLFELGRLMAILQMKAPVTKHRHYWDAEGLVGRNPKFGSMDRLMGVKPAEQRMITAARQQTFKKINAYAKKFPQRMGMVHADLHFGNLLKTKSGLGAIDFDDCGFGFKVYDLAVPMLSAEYTLMKKRKDHLPKVKKALIEGYRTLAPFDHHDEALLDHLITARKLMMLGWLCSRADNPRLKKYLRRGVRRVLAHIKTLV